jgi:hypothetical protein
MKAMDVDRMLSIILMFLKSQGAAGNLEIHHYVE